MALPYLRVPHLWIQPTTDRVVLYVFTGKKNLCISGPVQFNLCCSRINCIEVGGDHLWNPCSPPGRVLKLLTCEILFNLPDNPEVCTVTT